MSYKANKNDKARHIVCALFNLKDLPAPDDIRVKRIMRMEMKALDLNLERARKIISERK